MLPPKCVKDTSGCLQYAVKAEYLSSSYSDSISAHTHGLKNPPRAITGTGTKLEQSSLGYA